MLAAVIADGDPMRDMLPLFDAPDRAAPPAPGPVAAGGVRVGCGAAAGAAAGACRVAAAVRRPDRPRGHLPSRRASEGLGAGPPCRIAAVHSDAVTGSGR